MKKAFLPALRFSLFVLVLLMILPALPVLAEPSQRMEINSPMTIPANTERVISDTLITIGAGISDNQTAITVQNGATLTINKSSVLNLSDTENKIVVKVEPGGTLIIDNTEITGTQCSQTPFDIDHGSVKILNGSKVHDCEFFTLIYAEEAEIQISDSDFYNINGEIINLGGGSLDIGDNCHFYDNNAYDKLIWLNQSRVNIGASEFKRNSRILWHEGCIEESDAPCGINIEDGAVFEENNGGIDERYGGAIRTIDVAGRTPITIGAARFINNHSREFWGAIASIGPLTLKGTIFEGNSSETGGAIFLAEDTFTAENVKFINNTASMRGGAVALGNNFFRNDKTQQTISNAEFKNVSFTGNSVKSEAGISGGALYIGDDYHVYMKNLTITGNHADSFGGGISVGPTGELIIHKRSGASIFGNTAGTPEIGYQDISRADNRDKFQLPEKMSNGGFYHWNINEEAEIVSTYYYSRMENTWVIGWDLITDQTGSFIGSEPSYPGIPENGVLMQGNSALRKEGKPFEGWVLPRDYWASGGAIGLHGILEVGEEGTSFTITKEWSDEGNTAGRRPAAEAFLNGLNLLINDKPYPLGKVTPAGEETPADGKTRARFFSEADPSITFTVDDSQQDRWTVEVEGLPLTFEDKDSVFGLTETLTDYDSEVIKDGNGNFTITNTLRPIPTEVPTVIPTAVPTQQPDREWFRLLREQDALPQTGISD